MRNRKKKITQKKTKKTSYLLYKTSTRIQSAEKGNALLAVNVFFFSFLGFVLCILSIEKSLTVHGGLLAEPPSLSSRWLLLVSSCCEREGQKAKKERALER